MMAALAVLAKENYPCSACRTPARDAWASFRGAFWALMAPVIIIGAS